MAKLTWDTAGNKLYETGVSNGVLYPYTSSPSTVGQNYGPGVAWNGLSSVSESPDGAEANDIYADNAKYLSLISAETFGCTIEAYTYPDEFALCDGTASPADCAGMYIGQQTRTKFGLCYKTILGNDGSGDNYAYKLHLVYGCLASPSEKQYDTVNDSPEAISFSWEVNTTPVDITIDGMTLKPTATIVIDSSKFTDAVAKARLTALENKLYGTDASGETAATTAYLPLPAEVYTTLKTPAAG